MKYLVRVYSDKKGKEPFKQWLDKLSTQNQNRVEDRLLRIEAGNLGDYKSLGEDLYELRFNFGSGYRVYFTIERNIIVLLLSGGDKSSQKRDISKAKEMMEEYYESTK